MTFLFLPREYRQANLVRHAGICGLQIFNPSLTLYYLPILVETRRV